VKGEFPIALTNTAQGKDIATPVSAFLGKKLNGIHVLKCNEKKSSQR
jgi:hypothetical protein